MCQLVAFRPGADTNLSNLNTDIVLTLTPNILEEDIAQINALTAELEIDYVVD